MTFSEQKLRNYLERFGYQSIEVPTLEPASLFLTKAGDQIIERLMTFEHQGNLFALRPEFTASAAYRYLSEQRHDVVRWQFSGPIFENIREEGTNTARPYQRHSIDVELIGYPGSFADAEIVALAILSLQDQGLRAFTVKLGHVGLTRHLLWRFNLDDRALRFLLKQRADLYEEQITRDEVIVKLDRYLAVEKRDTATSVVTTAPAPMTTEMLSAVLSNTSRSQTLGGRTQHDIARRLLEKEQRAASRSQIIAALDFLIEWMAIRSPVDTALKQIDVYLDREDTIAQKLLNDWTQIVDHLQAYGIDPSHIELEPDLVRSWDYYNGMVFELQTRDDISLAGGGRYDDLAQLLGAPAPVPGVGFVYDVDAILSALGDETDTVQGILMTGSSKSVLEWSMMLRSAGLVVTVLPDAPAQPPSDLIHITENGEADYAGRVYALTELDQLVEQLLARDLAGARES
jgi:histidyl-tRNA synthetase